jgi:hypothetical protein
MLAPAELYRIRPSTLEAVLVVKSMKLPVFAADARARQAWLEITPAETEVTVGYCALAPAAMREDSDVVVPMLRPVFVSRILSVPERMCWKFRDDGEYWMRACVLVAPVVMKSIQEPWPASLVSARDA